MAIANYSKFEHYKSLIQSLPTPLTEDSMRSEAFLLETDPKKKLEIYYAPFEYINEQAKVVIVGITPGLHQMKMSFSTVLDAKNQLNNDEDILHQVKNNSSFEGPMRKNLVQMLDELGLNEYLGLDSTIELFDEASHLVQTTSVIPYPVFRDGKNYSGSAPKILKTEVLKRYATEYFAKEMSNFDQALIIPLGVNVSEVLSYLADNHILNRDCLLTGFPHPSGANGKRKEHFEMNKEQMKEMIRAHFQKEAAIKF
ncbi:uracil-DNA glycosylase family protein [Bacillus sp. JJ722]|uniref:uracil-DNA glycosylase family protein n=1 Tax=Bacillus sp. JJ722 TaxID=3122973 RepID=UPI002FFEE650